MDNGFTGGNIWVIYLVWHMFYPRCSSWCKPLLFWDSGLCTDHTFYTFLWIILVIKQHSRLTAEPEEVIDAFEQLHSHVVVDQSILQHACLEAQVSHVLPHSSLAALLIIPEIKGVGGENYVFFSVIVFSGHQNTALLFDDDLLFLFLLSGGGRTKVDQSVTKSIGGWENTSRGSSRLNSTTL